MKTTKEMIEVMQAYERGEQIEAKSLNNDIYGWDETKEPFWDWHNLDYRVKPNYVPFESAEEFLEAQRKHGIALFDEKSKIICYCYVNCNGLVCATRRHTYKNCTFQEAFENYIFWDDSTPCGKEVEL